ncbi:MAG: DUF4249 family protein [Candidatus Kapabacteria bacterium]|nr:DUF4249 family protein [Candidatus Kapabacteria bacterium]
MNRLRHIILSGMALIVAILASGCEDPVPTDYKEEIMLEGLLLVGEPLQDVRILKTLPVTDTFSFERASLPDAKISVFADGVSIPMEFIPDSRGGTYRAVDTSYRVKAATLYSVAVRANGATLTASTRTPATFAWITPPKTWIRFPQADSLLTAVDDSLLVTWSPVQGTELYIIGLTCLDTLGYGAYLDPPTSDTNLRTVRPKPDFFDRSGTLIANERTTLGATPFTTSQTVWGVFRWYGQHELRVYAPDGAFLEWFYLVGGGRRSSYDYRLGNIRGGLGVWGSASLIKQRSFLLKYDG